MAAKESSMLPAALEFKGTYLNLYLGEHIQIYFIESMLHILEE